MRSVASLLCFVAFVLSCLVWHNCDAQLSQQHIDRNFPHFPSTTSNEDTGNDDDSDEFQAAQRLTALVNQYRSLIAKSILRLSDACSVYERLAVSPPSDPNEGRQSVINMEQYIAAILQQLRSQTADQIAATFARQNVTEPGVNVLFYIVTTSAMLKDPQLDALMASMLYERCCTSGGGVGGGCASNVGKRQPTTAAAAVGTPQKKQRFHAWGGKKRAGNKIPAQIVIRAPFHAWGGRKRSEETGWF